MLDVFLTCDVEVWCKNWTKLDSEFPDAFARHIYGRTSKGDFGLPFQVRLLHEHGLKGVFFVESLFATRFGIGALKEIVGIVDGGRQEVQLHLHTEWVDEASPPLVAAANGKRRLLSQFPAEHQAKLVATGAALLRHAGAKQPVAFRAGNCGFNLDSLRALREAGIRFDSSYNATQFGPESGVAPGDLLFDATQVEGIYEYPVSVFRDGLGRLRHAQIGACAAEEIEQVLWQALEAGQKACVLLFHGFELMNRSRSEVDRIVLRRFERLCRFMADNSCSFRSVGFADLVPRCAERQLLFRSSGGATGKRVFEQLARRVAL